MRMLGKLRRLVAAKLTHQGTARTAMAVVIATALAAGCGVHKSDDGGAGDAAAGTGGSSGSGTGGSRAGTGGQTFDVGSFDLNLDGFSLDGFGADISISTCPTGVKTGDACTNGETFCTGSGGRGCYCNGGKWFCLGG
jgi:hypothetical protein